MVNNKDADWHHKILMQLLKKESVFHVHLNANGFLKNVLGIEDNDGNRGRKLVTKLKELSTNGLIRWEWSGHDGTQQIGLDIDNDTDNVSVTLNKYWFNAELTFRGIEYINGYLRLNSQQGIERQNKNLTGLNIVIALLTGGFIALTAIDAHQNTTSKELKAIDSTLQVLTKQIQLKQYNPSPSHEKNQKENLDTSQKTNLSH